MSHKQAFIGLVASVALLTGCQQESSESTAAAEASLDSNQNQISYLIGYSSAAQMVANGIDVDLAAYQLGAADAIAGADSRISDEQADAAFAVLQQEMQAQAEAQFNALLTENSAAAEAFLASNAGAEGVMTTESGLQYKVLVAAEGPMPAATDTVSVHYEGRLIDGTVFDSSYQRGAPVEFALNQVIAGWTEGVQLMPEGSTYELYVPPALGYGEAGAGGVIGPNELLIFKVELLDASVEAGEAE